MGGGRLVQVKSFLIGGNTREVSSLKHLGKGRRAAQTLYRESAMQSPRSDPMTLALKTTSNSFQHSGGSGRPFPEHKGLSQYICVFSVNCSVLIKLS